MVWVETRAGYEGWDLAEVGRVRACPIPVEDVSDGGFFDLEGADGKVLVDRHALEYVLVKQAGDYRFCGWPDCQFAGTGSGRVDERHSGTCPLREEA